MALRPLRSTNMIVHGGTVRVGVPEIPAGQEGDLAPAKTDAVLVPPAVKRLMFKPLHKGERPYDAAWGPPIKYLKIPGGEPGTIATLKVMKELVLGKWGHRNPEVVMLSKKIAAGVSPGPKKDYRAMVTAILDFMKKNTEVFSKESKAQHAGIDYQLDPAGLEWVQTPWYTLCVEGTGDCDDMATAASAIAMSLGLKAAFRTVRGDPSRPDQWSHVYPVIGFHENGKLVWLTADGTEPKSFPGWDPPQAKLYGMKTWEIDPRIQEGSSWDS